MRANDFSVTTPEGQSRWCITHTPSGAEVLSLAKHAYSSVAVLQEGGKLFVRASYPDTTYLDMPIRNDENTQQQQQPEAILSVEVLGTQHVVIVHANLGETVAQLKLRLASQCGIPAHEQALWLGKSQIESDRLPLRSTGLAVPGAYVRVGRSGKLRIGVRCGASVARLMVYPATTVAQLREIAGSKMNISLVRPVVAFAGRELAEEATLRECGIRAGYEVDLVARGGHLKAEQSGVVHKEEGGGEMGEVLGTVATLVGQQAALQETVSHLLQSYAGSSVKRRSPHHPLAYAGAPPGEDPSRAVDILSQSRKLRATASMEASSALSMTQVSGLPPPEIPHGNRTDILHQLAREARTLAEEHSASSCLNRMENTRKEYQMLRQEIQMDNLKRNDGSCKLCGVKPGEPVKGAAKETPSTTSTKPTTTGSKGPAEPASKPTGGEVARKVNSSGSVVAAMRRQSASAACGRAKTSDDVLVPTSRPPPATAPPSRHSSLLGGTVAVPAALRKKPTSATTDDVLVSKAKPKAKDDSDNESVMGDHVMGDPEAVAAWMKERGK